MPPTVDTPPVRVSLLGPVRVAGATDADLVVVRSSSATVVTALALAPGRALSAAGLAEEVWPEELPRPQNLRASLQTVVSRLRARCAPGLVVSGGDGYGLALRTGTVDLDLAEMLLDRARAALRAPDAVRAERLVRRALDLWRGEPGSGLAEGALRREVVQRAARAAHHLRLIRAEALLALGRYDEAAELAASLVADDPHDDALCLVSMRALAASGRPGQAVDAFDALRVRLREDLGTDPAPELADFHGALLRDEIAPVPPCAIRSGLRTAPNALVGRDEDVSRVARLVGGSRLVSVVGEGGLGKSRVAREVVDRVADGFSAVFAIDLAGVRRAAEVPLAVAAALGVPGAPGEQGEQGTRSATAALERHVLDVVSAQRTLLVLDSCEHVLPEAATWAADLLAATDAVRMLVTSRAPLRIAAERVHVLAPLALEAADGSPGAAALLFAERARAVRPDARLEEVAVSRLCRRLDGNPLAIELAASRTRSLTVEEIETRLTGRLDLLAGGDRGVAARHGSLDAVVRWSWDLLTDGQRRLARLASVFPDGFGLAALTALLREPAVPGDDADVGAAALDDLAVLDALDALVDQSLIRAEDDPRGASTRYRMSTAVREFAAARRTEHGEDELAQRAAARWCAAFAGATVAGVFSTGQEAALGALAVERGTLLGVLDRALDAGDAATAVPVHAALGLGWLARGEYAQLTAVAGRVLAVGTGFRPARDLVTALQWSRLLVAGPLLLFHGPEAAANARAQLRLALGDPRGCPPTVRTLGALVLADDKQTALDVLTSAADGPDPVAARLALWFLANAADDAGRAEQARDLAERAHALAVGAQDTWTRSRVAELLAGLHSAQGRATEAVRWWRDALSGLNTIGADTRLPTARLAIDRLRTGDRAGAAHALTRSGGHDDPPSELRLMREVGLAECALADGDLDEGLHRYRAAVLTAGTGTVHTVFWELLAGSGCVAAHVAAGRAAEATDVVRGLRRRTVDAHRAHPGHADMRLLGTVTLVLAAWAEQRARDPRDIDGTGDPDPVAAGLRAVAGRLGGRFELPALAALADARGAQRRGTEAGPGVLETALAAVEALEVTAPTR